MIGNVRRSFIPKCCTKALLFYSLAVFTLSAGCSFPRRISNSSEAVAALAALNRYDVILSSNEYTEEVVFDALKGMTRRCYNDSRPVGHASNDGHPYSYFYAVDFRTRVDWGAPNPFSLGSEKVGTPIDEVDVKNFSPFSEWATMIQQLRNLTYQRQDMFDVLTGQNPNGQCVRVAFLDGFPRQLVMNKAGLKGGYEKYVDVFKADALRSLNLPQPKRVLSPADGFKYLQNEPQAEWGSIADPIDSLRPSCP